MSFEITRAYSGDEMKQNRKTWDNSHFDKHYFDALAPCALAMNNWLASLRQ